ncbi:NIPSNAP family protein [Pedobacter polysacchareus]|uniref:NIPSNAP family protein n=1 Tax=Pedobacter polysacchareus TaxID=2861973 RepID=UPI001C98E577|nr:NIPSNAP family protein [Pedobacter polysacchareus]
MKRRVFVKTTILSSAAAAILPRIGFAQTKPDNKTHFYYELRTYTLKDANQQTLVEDYFEKAAIPALNRLGIKNVGVFTELKPSGQSILVALIPYQSLQEFETINNRLEQDKLYTTAGAAYLNASATEPAYERIKSSLLKAFKNMPGIELPPKDKRIFELRRYEHATEAAGAKKREMFNDKGEIDIFKRLGFKPVFFGETIIGEARPNLIYMVTFDDMAAHDQHWKSFSADPEWKKISVIPEYADSKLVSKITTTFLQPTEYSQI